MSQRLRTPVLVTLAFLASAAGALWVVTRDESAPDIADLSPRPRTLPPEQNGYLALTRLGDETGFPKFDEAAEAAFERLTYDRIWNETDALLLLKGNDVLLERFAAALALPQGESPLPQHITELTPHVGGLQRLWRLHGVRAELVARNGDSEEATRHALRALEGTRAITTAGGPLFEYVVGSALRGTALRTLHDIIALTPPSTDTLRSCLPTLDGIRSTPADFSENLKAEFAFTQIALRELPSHYREWENASFGLSEKAPLQAHWFFKPNKTLRLLAERQRALIQHTDRPLAKWDTSADSDNPVLFWRLPHPENALGRYMIDSTSGTFWGVVRARLRDQSNLSLHQAWIGVSIYEREHGHLPSSLDMLVPNILTSIPSDYYTGDPIRYSPELRTLWSAGEDNLIISSHDGEIPERALVLKAPTYPR